MKLITTISLILLILLPAPQSKASSVETSLVTFYSKKLIYRGALIWDAPSAGIGPSFKINNRFQIGKGGLSIFAKPSESSTFRLGFSSLDDNGPNGLLVKLEESEKDYKNTRNSTYGTYLAYQYRYKRFFNFSLRHNWDLQEYHGQYSTIRMGVMIIPLINIGFVYDYGDQRSNQYAYGPEGKSAGGYSGYTVSVLIPFLPFKGILRIAHTKMSIIQDENINADYVRGNKNNENTMAFAIWRL